MAFNTREHSTWRHKLGFWEAKCNLQRLLMLDMPDKIESFLNSVLALDN